MNIIKPGAHVTWWDWLAGGFPIRRDGKVVTTSVDGKTLFVATDTGYKQKKAADVEVAQCAQASR